MRRYKLWSTSTQNRIAIYDTLKEALKAGKAYTADTSHGFWITHDGSAVYRALAKKAADDDDDSDMSPAGPL